MLLSPQSTPASRCCRRRRSYPPLKPSARLHPKNPILAPPRPSKLHLRENPTAWGYRGVMTELTRFAALGRGKGMEEDGGTGEAQAILEREAPDLARRFSWRGVEPLINKMTKWIVSALFGLLILWKHDAESMWVAMGSVLNSMLSIALKRILNHERPVAGLRSDPGMPSSHAQSIFYIDVTVILLMFHSMGLNPFTATVGSIALFIGSYLVCTQRSWKRPFGVGLLVAGLDETGAHLYYNCPSGSYFEYQAFAIGSRSQAAKTFLERRFESFNTYSRDELIKDAIFAIKETLQGDKLTSSICTVAIVGQDEAFHMIDQKVIQEIIDSMEIKEDVPAEQAPLQEEDKGSEEAPMDI